MNYQEKSRKTIIEIAFKIKINLKLQSCHFVELTHFIISLTIKCRQRTIPKLGIKSTYFSQFIIDNLFLSSETK